MGWRYNTLDDEGPNYDYDIPSDPTEQLPFEIEAADGSWTFLPEYYPDRFPQNKKTELRRQGRQCNGEDVSPKSRKNREFHVQGVVLAHEVPTFQKLVDYESEVNLYSPVSPTGGTECLVSSTELNVTPEGYDSGWREWRFSYSVDLVSTGRDEYGSGENAIVSDIVEFTDSQQSRIDNTTDGDTQGL